MINDKRELIRSRFIDPDSPIIDALKQMDQVGTKLLIIQKENSFINLISIGDLQRAIIKNTSLSSPISSVTRKKVRVASPDMTENQIKKVILEHRMEFLPVIKEKQILDVFFWEEFFENTRRIQNNLNLPVVIMAGGVGTRLRPITHVIPKPLIPVGEYTMLEHIMSKFSQEGCNDFYLTINYKSDMIKYYMGGKKDNPYNIHYIEENTPLGTAGSLGLINKKFTSPIFVTNCDIYVNENYSEIFDYHKKNENDITVVAAILNHHIPYGCLETGKNGILQKINEKPTFTYKINAGFYIIEPKMIDEIPKNTFFHITHLIDKCIANSGKVGVFPISQKSWVDIGQWDKYLSIKDGSDNWIF